MSQTVITCPRCRKKVAEQELKPSDHIRFYCEACKKPFWKLAELKIRTLIEYEKED
jgi:hypothetical protein